MTAPHAELSRNVVAFAARLRDRHGFLVGPGETADALRALDVADLGSVTQVRDVLRPVLCATREQQAIFDEVFAAFFLGRVVGTSMTVGPAERGAKPGQRGEPGGEEAGAAGEARDATPNGEGDGPMVAARFSTLEASGQPPTIAAKGLEDMLAVASRLVARLSRGRARTWRPAPRGRRLDFRRTFRLGLPSGGEITRLRWLHHPRRHPRFLIVLDGSRSMAAHTGLLLQFAYALTQRARHVEVFLFSTDLRHATPELRRMVRQGVTGQLSGLGYAWGGGTRIGENLARVVREYPRLLTRDTVTFVLSDGLDVGEPERLGWAMHEIARRTAGVVWLNPLLATPGYTPTARGMQAALPHVAYLAAAGDLAALRDVADEIQMRG